MKRVLFDVFVIMSCIFAPWLFTVTMLIIGIYVFESWLEGLICAVFLNIMMFGGVVGISLLYTILGFCALYYLSIRFKRLLRVV